MRSLRAAQGCLSGPDRVTKDLSFADSQEDMRPVLPPFNSKLTSFIHAMKQVTLPAAGCVAMTLPKTG